MRYIIIEVSGGAEYATICTPYTGRNAVFRNYDEAEEWAEENCQDYIIVEVL